MLVESNGQLQRLIVDNPHPEISWSALWGKVWYESYDEPKYVWQSTSANTDFEPKMSLAPLPASRFTPALLHLGHFLSGSSRMDWNCSNWCPHLGQAYS